MLSRMSVSITYPFLLLALVVGVGFLFGGLGVTGTERTSRDLLDRLTDETTERVRLAIRTNLDAPYKLSNLNASLIRNGSMKVDDVRTLIPSLQSQLDTYPGISAVLVSNAALDTVWVERRGSGPHVVAISDGKTPPNTCVEWHIDDAGIIVGDPIGQYEYDPESRPWFKAAVDSPVGGAWCPIYPWATSDGSSNPIGTGYSVDVRDEAGRSMAVVDVGFTVESISNYLSGIQVATNGHVFIMNGDGYLVATDRPDAPSSLQGRLVPANHSSNPLVAHAAEMLADEDSTYVDDQGFTHAEFTEHDGALYLVDMNGLDVSWAPDWRIVTVIPEDDLLIRVREVQDRLLFWGLVVLGVAAILGILLALSIARPIIGLQRAAAGITGGDFDVQFPGGGGREFAQLARELDSMCLGLKERLELRTSLEVAMEVQQHLLPTGVPASELLDIAAFSTYCDETGGDYYDFPEASNVEAVDDGSLLVAIGDVTGHGIAAALIMATARASLRTRLRQRGSIGDVLSDVNEIMVTDSPDGKFMTFLAVLVAPDASGFKWASAGHDPPILLDGATGEFSEPEGGGIPLGILADQEYPEYVCPIGPSGSIVLTGTDGIWETASPEKELYGKERLCEVIRAHAEEDARTIGDAIIADLNAFRGSDRPLDDVTMVILKRK
jgi:sigma-B regulation protein RsbU (phosphoserine phosphatase)